MIDILTVVHKNYALLALQRLHWKHHIQGDFRLIVADNTPAPQRQPCGADFILDLQGIDGETHGAAMDFLMTQATSDIVGTVDTDFFWVKPDILSYTQSLLSQGLLSVGAGAFYRDFQQRIDPLYPERAGSKAPAVWGMFVHRQLALQHTFVVTSEEARTYHETGWRLRAYLSNQPTLVLTGHESPSDPELYWLGQSPQQPWGFHLLKGSSSRANLTQTIPDLIHAGLAAWDAV